MSHVYYINHYSNLHLKDVLQSGHSRVWAWQVSHVRWPLLHCAKIFDLLVEKYLDSSKNILVLTIHSISIIIWSNLPDSGRQTREVANRALQNLLGVVNKLQCSLNITLIAFLRLGPVLGWLGSSSLRRGRALRPGEEPLDGRSDLVRGPGVQPRAADGQQPPLLRPHPREEPRHVPGQEEGEQREAADPGLLQQPHRVLDTTLGTIETLRGQGNDCRHQK